MRMWRIKKLDKFIIFFIFFLTLVIFKETFFKGKIPAPLDFLVAFNFPWYYGGYEGYTAWVPYKGVLNADVVRQSIPWRTLIVDQLKKGKLALWNPYNFCGNPLMANFQSAQFYPINLIFLIFDFPSGWTIYIILQLVLGLYFTYLFLRENKLSKIASSFGSLAFLLNTFLVSWFELGVVGHTLIWLPLICFFSLRYKDSKTNKKTRYLIFTSIVWVLSLFAGHPLSFICAFASYLLYILLLFGLTKDLLRFLVASFFGLLLGMIQILPTVEFYLNSFLGNEFSRRAFAHGTIPFRSLITFLAPGFYGNHSTGNWWGYEGPGELTPFIGVISLVLIYFTLLFGLKKKDKKVRIFSVIWILSLLAALPTPLNFIIGKLKIPIISSTAPARMLIPFYFASAFLIGWGLDYFLKNKLSLKHFLPPFLIIGFVYITVGIKTFLNYQREVDLLQRSRFMTGLRNLVIPIGVFGFSFVCLFVYNFFRNEKKIKNKRKITGLIYFALFFNLFLFIHTTNKFLSFAPKKLFYPKHIVLTWLRNQGVWRFHGLQNTEIGTNFQIPYKVYSPAGYDVLRIKDYGELVTSTYEGFLQLSEDFSRADAYFPWEDKFFKERIFDLIGVKYIVGKIEDPKSDWEPDLNTFPQDKYNLVWQQEKFQIYERKSVFPRAFLVNNYLVENDGNKIIEKIYDKNIDLRKILILSGNIPTLPVEKSNNDGMVEIIDYQPNNVRIRVNHNANSLLFLSDAYYPGWQAFVDGNKTDILKANYAFRSVYVPSGEHVVEFVYKPASILIGLRISFVSILVLSIFTFLMIKKKKF